MELTDKCNASCPMCGRNENGGPVKDFIHNKEIDLTTFKSLIPNALIDQLDQIRFCGNFGDPIIATDLLEICVHIKKVSAETIIKINTNGSMRSKSWWKELAHTLTHKKDEVVFAIDGLADTHALYRKGTDFNRVIENAESFIQNGGNASWVMLMFEHNEHQIKDCEALAHKLGFKNYRIKKTKRFFDSKTLNTSNNFENLAPPKTPDYRHEYFDLKLSASEWKEYLQKTSIDCKALSENSIYIDATGKLSPCCWLGVQDKFGKYPAADLNSRSLLHSIDDKFNHNLLSRWEAGENRCHTCARICGKEFKPFEGQF